MRRPVGSCEGQWLDPGVAESAAAPNAPVSALHRSTLSGLLTSLPNLLRLSASSSLPVSKIKFEHYSKLLGYPTWNQFLQFIDYTRSFDRGLELGLLLLAAHEQFKDQISPENRERNAASIHSLVLRTSSTTGIRAGGSDARPAARPSRDTPPWHRRSRRADRPHDRRSVESDGLPALAPASARGSWLK